jgi:hypothetical protein
MAKARVTKLRNVANDAGHAGRAGDRRSSAPVERPDLEPGLHPGIVEERTGSTRDVVRVRLFDGGIHEAVAAPGVAAALVDECMRDRRTVLLSRGPKGEALIVGALQTAPSVASTDRDERALVHGTSVELTAEHSIALRVGKSTVTIDKHGVVRLAGQRMTLDMAALVRVLSAHVELP